MQIICVRGTYVLIKDCKNSGSLANKDYSINSIACPDLVLSIYGGKIEYSDVMHLEEHTRMLEVKALGLILVVLRRINEIGGSDSRARMRTFVQYLLKATILDELDVQVLPQQQHIVYKVHKVHAGGGEIGGFLVSNI